MSLEKTVLVTGSTAGLGLATAKDLAARGASVLIHGRDPERCRRALGEVRDEAAGACPRHYLADFAGLEQVRRLADEIGGAEERLDVLINNAGVAIIDGRRESADGLELTFAVNHLAHFLLTLELLPLLRRSTPARIVNVSSIGQREIDLDDLMLERDYDWFDAYARSKLAQVMFTFELAERLEAAGERGVTANCLHPATLMDTKMVRRSFGRARSTVAEGVEPTVRLAVGEEVEGVSGRYFDGLEEGAPHPQAHDAEARRRLWALSERLCATSSPV